MQLDKFSDYALRLLVCLAVKAPNRVSVAEIARLYDVSENHLSKVATQLVKLGYVTSTRGRAGGLALGQEAEAIRIGEVLRRLKQDDPVVECFGTTQTCAILPACGLRQPLKQAQEAFFASLDAYSLADVTQARSQLASLLAS